MPSLDRKVAIGAVLLPLFAALCLVLFPDTADSSEGSYTSGFQWSGKRGISITVYDATLTSGLSDAVLASAGEWNQSSVVKLYLERVPGDCRDRRSAIVVCEGEDCSGNWALTTTKGKNQIASVRINLMAGCGDWAFRDTDSRLSAACHELGHALGLAHRPLQSQSCMANNGSTEPDATDFETLQQMYGQ